MIVVLPDLHGAPRVLQLDRREVVELARVIHGGPGEDESSAAEEPDGFVASWARLRGSMRQAKHFANLKAALHFYRFGNHGLCAREAARIVRKIHAAGLAQGSTPT
jgi:hypothetical protein